MLAGVAIFFVVFLGVLFAIGAVYVPFAADSAPVYHPPTEPHGVVAVAGDRSAQVEWKKPHDDGGAAELTYIVVADPGGATCTVTGLLTCAVSGLVDGTAYTFTVLARNDSGDGPPSAPSEAVTPVGPPGAPTAVTVTPGHNAITVEWTAPADDGGSPIVEYVVTGVSAVDGSVHTCAWTSGPLECTVHGPKDRDSHTFTVVARNAVGVGPASEPSPDVVPLGVPDAPMLSGVQPVAADTLRVAFTHRDAADLISPAYAVRCRATTGPAVSVTGDTSPIDVGGLTVGRAYTCAVRAQNANGWSVYAPDSAPAVSGYRLTIGTTAGNGAVRIVGAWKSCAATCSFDETAGIAIVLAAAPAAGSQLTGWSGACTGAAATCAITMDDERIVGAAFAPAPAGGGDGSGGDPTSGQSNGAEAGAGGDPANATQIVMQSVHAAQLVHGVRWSTPRGGWVTARFQATVGARYALRAARGSQATNGVCSVSGAKVMCRVLLRPSGAWRLTITPTLAGTSAAVVRKTIRT